MGIVGVVSRRRVWLDYMGVVSRRWVSVESMGVASGCGCKDVYIFSHITYTYNYTPLVSDLFLQHPYFLLIFKNIFGSC